MSSIKTFSIPAAVMVAVLALVVVVLGALGASGGASVAHAADPTPCPTATTNALPTFTPPPVTFTPAPGNPPQCLGPISVPMQAVVGAAAGGGTALTIECKWEAPDMTPYDAPITYGTVGHRDDTPWVIADTPPCAPPGPAVNDRHHMVGIVANAENLPIQRQYEKWVAIQAADLSAIRDVYFDVFEPYVPFPPNGPNCGPNTVDPITGAIYTSLRPTQPIRNFPQPGLPENLFCLEEQHHATPDQDQPRGTPGCVPASPAVPNDPCNPLQSVPCTQLGGATAIYGNMFAQAIENGAMTAAEQADIIDKCGQGQKAIFRVPDNLTKDKPCGQVRVEVTAVNEAGTPVSLANYFDNVCFIHLQLDFASVNWQTVPSTGNATIGGDMVFDPGLTNVACSPVGGAIPCMAPTVLNTGNAPMYIETMFDPLVPVPGTGPSPDKRINSFDSKLRASWQPDSLNFEAIDPQPSDRWHCFGTQPIGHDQTGKIDFSLHTTGAQAGSWTGHVYIVARFNCAAPHNDAPNGPPGSGGFPAGTPGGTHPNTPAGGHPGPLG